MMICLQIIQDKYEIQIKINILKQKQSKMSGRTIPEMNKKLQSLSAFFNQQTTEFCREINRHEGKLNINDQQQFGELIEKIKNYAITEITSFFNQKIDEKCEIYDSQITTFTESGEQTSSNLIQFREELEEDTVELKLTQNRKENLLQHFSAKYNRNATLKKFWAILKKNKDESLKQKETYKRMKQLYAKNLLKKSFFPWRRLTYKEGYESTVKRQTERDTLSIHEQYQSIITILKNKITETDQVIKVKKAAKGQFAYALSKNLLKTISNLSLEVMSLNQMSLRDGETSEQETHQFMNQIDTIISQKLKKVHEFKSTLVSQEDAEGEEGRKKKKIKFLE